VTIASFAISGLLFALMIGISWYGAVTLPSDARIPLHYGLGSYNNFAPKTAGLILWPVGGAVVFTVLAAVSEHAIKPNHGGKSSASLIILPIVLAVLIATQWGAISLARRNTAAPLDH
jgi:hypothetical protein